MDIVEAVVDLVEEDMEGVVEEDTEGEEPEALEEVVAVGGGLGEEDSGEEEGDSAGATEDHHRSGLILDCIVTIMCAIFIDFHVNFCKILFLDVLLVLYVENIHTYLVLKWMNKATAKPFFVVYIKFYLVSQNSFHQCLC